MFYVQRNVFFRLERSAIVGRKTSQILLQFRRGKQNNGQQFIITLFVQHAKMLTFKIPLRSVALNDFFCWKCSRRSSKLSSLSWPGCSNDTFEPFNDGFDAVVCAVFFKFDNFALSNTLGGLVMVSPSSLSRIGLNVMRWCVGGKSVLSLALSITTVSRLVEVDEFDREPSAVSTRE